MTDLTLTGLADNALILSSESGEEFRLPLADDVVAAVRKQAQPAHRTSNAPRPREIQALLRSGLSIDQVASQTGVSHEDVERFEAPVRAELEYIVESAQSLALTVAGDAPGDVGSSFGEIIRNRLSARTATDAQWSSWREEDSQWIVQLEFSVSGIAKDARWAFDPKRKTIEPANDDARALLASSQVSTPETPRLRSVPGIVGTDDDPFVIDRSNEPSSPSVVHDESEDSSHDIPTAPLPSPVAPAAPVASVTPLGSRLHSVATEQSQSTEDLLDALRRRRGEPQNAPLEPGMDDFLISPDSHPADAHDGNPHDPHDAPKAEAHDTTDIASPRKGNRPSMPSWEEIVFGSRGRGDDAS